MTKAFLQFVFMVSVFMATWFLFSRIDYTSRMDLDKLSEEQEKKLGELLLDNLRLTKDELKRDSLNEIARDLLDKICSSNKIDKNKIKVRVFKDKEVNAFAMPGDQLIVLTGLVNYCKTPEELAGVMAHEIAHIENDHVMKKLVKEVGIAMLFAIAGGNSSFEIIGEVLQTISSRAFDRDQETEADLYAVKLLSNAHINPAGLSDFLFRLSQESEDAAEEMLIISTHPGSSDRAATILKEIKKQKSHYNALTYTYWENRSNSGEN